MFAIALTYALCFLFALGPLAARAAPFPPSFRDAVANRGSQRQIAAFLDAHNVVRAAHNATALQWSPDLANAAASWADQCQFKHSGGVLRNELYGENIAAATGRFPIHAAVDTFVSDKDQYDPAHPSYLRFTQVVWKSTTEVGCAISRCDGIFDKSLGRASLYVCLYNPVGNVVGQAPENVQV